MQDLMFPKDKRIRSPAILKSARNEECTVRIPGICNWNPETTVFAHVGGAGERIKSHDYKGAYCCSACHDEIDRRTRIMEADFVKAKFNEGRLETIDILVKKGLIIIK